MKLLMSKFKAVLVTEINGSGGHSQSQKLISRTSPANVLERECERKMKAVPPIFYV